ncbi:MAG: ribosomal protein S18-alanine N-acetyltransferase [Gammaproteobacteria bacterium]|nr:ribosomal protein S18-alanine N-acetyltransferase [Gammaproteobacteria bacterium]
MSAVLDEAPYSFRRMGENDLEAVLGIESESYQFPWTRGIFLDCLRVGYPACVVEVDDAVSGYSVMTVGAGDCHILNLCIAPVQRRDGHGRALLEYMLNAALRQRARTAYLEVRPSNVSALRLYEAAGFVEVGVRKAYYPADDGREDALVLSRNLGSAR